jgi:FtsJ-like methyltransferase
VVLYTTRHLTNSRNATHLIVHTYEHRSQDYNALLWAIQQFFEGHQAVKPASSRSQSAEIFIVGTGYKAPDHIDPRMLDPKHVFDQVSKRLHNVFLNVFLLVQRFFLVYRLF